MIQDNVMMMHFNEMKFTGLSKFAHLINVDFFTDLFECLKRIIKEETLDLSDSLNCVSTIFTILSGLSDHYSAVFDIKCFVIAL